MSRISAVTIVLAILMALIVVPVGAARHEFVMTLSGSNEVPANKSEGIGQVVFRVNKSEQKLEYKLTVSSLRDIRGAHIHLGAPGKNGPVVVNLFTGSRMGPFSGTLATGTITKANLVGPLAAKTIADLVREMEKHNAYVNVHTDELPEGELRGDIR